MKRLLAVALLVTGCAVTPAGVAPTPIVTRQTAAPTLAPTSPSASPLPSPTSRSSLTGKTWQLTTLTHRFANGLGGVPEADQANYTIEFKSDGNYQAKADCNQTSGTYTTTSDGGLTNEPGPTTLVACPVGSLSDQYIKSLTIASSYTIAHGQLTIMLKDGWSLEFK